MLILPTLAHSRTYNATGRPCLIDNNDNPLINNNYYYFILIYLNSIFFIYLSFQFLFTWNFVTYLDYHVLRFLTAFIHTSEIVFTHYAFVKISQGVDVVFRLCWDALKTNTWVWGPF